MKGSLTLSTLAKSNYCKFYTLKLRVRLVFSDSGVSVYLNSP